MVSTSASQTEGSGFNSRYERRVWKTLYYDKYSCATQQLTLSCVIRIEVSHLQSCILPRKQYLQFWSNFATAGITKLMHAFETGNSSPASILHLGVVPQETECFTFTNEMNKSFLVIQMQWIKSDVFQEWLHYNKYCLLLYVMGSTPNLSSKPLELGTGFISRRCLYLIIIFLGPDTLCP